MPIVQCDNYGKLMDQFPYQLKDSKRHFCCRECANLAMRNNKIHHTVKCHSCGKSIERRVTTQKHFFCNDRCRGDWMKHARRGENSLAFKPRNRKCEYCGKSVRRSPAHLKRNTIHFCSIECKSKWQSENWCGENNPLWKGGECYYGKSWKYQRRKARKRDKYICQSCGMSEKENGQALDAHHIIPFRKFNYIPDENENHKQANRLSNLVCLCRQCHQFVERGRIAVQLSLPIS